MSGSINLGIPDIAVVLRENTDTNNVVLDVPNISVTVEHAPDYKVSVQPSSLIVHRTGSLPSLAVSALTASYALSASYIAGGTFTSASYAVQADTASLATTASYALNAQGTGFPFSGSAVITGSLVVTGTVSASSITGSFSGDGSQLTGIATTLKITGSTGQDSIDLKTQGLLVTGSNGIITTVTDNTVTIAAPPGTVTASAQINVFQTTGGDNVASLGANTFNGKQTIFGDLEIDTGNIVVTSGNSLIVSGAIFAQNEFIGGFVSASTIQSPSITGSLLGTASYVDPAGLPPNTVSSSTQVLNYNVFATTGSNVFIGEQKITGSLDTTTSVKSKEFRLNAGDVSVVFTGSVTSGIFGATEYILPFMPINSFSATTVEYVASRQGALRVGVILAGWSGSQSTVTDISSTDVGDTSDIRFSIVQDGGYIKLRVESLGSGSYPWTVQSLFKLFPTLS